jgi:hypothetical protein
VQGLRALHVGRTAEDVLRLVRVLLLDGHERQPGERGGPLAGQLGGVGRGGHGEGGEKKGSHKRRLTTEAQRHREDQKK